MTSRSEWTSKQERTNSFWLRLLLWVTQTFGRNFTRWVLLPILVLVYVLFDPAARRASHEFLTRINGEGSIWSSLQHFFTFATVSLDRLLLLDGKSAALDVQISGESLFDDLPHGAILVTSHFGSFDVMRVLADELRNLEVHILLDVEHNAATLAMLNALNPQLANRIVDAGQSGPQLVVRLQRLLERDCLLGIMADRMNPGQAYTELEFLGAKAAFPLGPWVLASILERPVILCFGVYLGGNRYKIEFEPLPLDDLTGRAKNKAIAAADRYSQRLESQVRTNPLNWFNFYDFWSNSKNSETNDTL